MARKISSFCASHLLYKGPNKIGVGMCNPHRNCVLLVGGFGQGTESFYFQALFRTEAFFRTEAL